MSRSLAYLRSVSLERVKGIGPARARRLEKAGLTSVADLLLHAPRTYLDRSRRFDLAAVPVGEEVTVVATVVSSDKRRISRNRTMVTGVVGDGTSTMRVVSFNPYLRLEPGEEVVLAGTVEVFRGRLQMKNPDVERLGRGALVTGRIVPIHPGVGGMGPNHVRRAVAEALRRSRPIADVLPEAVLDRLDLLERDRAIAALHFPEDLEEAEAARRRLVFDEFLRLQVALALRKRRHREGPPGVAHRLEGPLRERFLAGLPFTLTAAQRRAVNDILADMAAPEPMHRLLQGEVGSGKTLVALAALLTAAQGGHQAAVMAPTEVLAVQHHLVLVRALRDAGLVPDAGPGPAGTGSLFAGAGPQVRVALLTGSLALTNFADAPREQVVEWVADGTVDVVVGTHALIEEGVRFRRLGLAVVDEQHRFGVGQRVRLREKGSGSTPDLLIMTATPIPRTLAMTLYGDLEVSVIDEMPPGRTPVRTIAVGKGVDDRRRVLELVRREVEAGRQAYVVCPLVEDSDKLEARSATETRQRLAAELPELRVGLLHGRLPPREKDAVMSAFRDGALDVLVATTVIEVGVDVPNATVMVIEDADRFGLSQLHQLRGRVGRGRHPATCVLVAEPTTPEGRRRIDAMVATTDGFRIAEEDLAIRGQGTVLGERQAGASDLRLADLLRDVDQLVEARRVAFSLVDDDAALRAHRDLAHEVAAFIGEDAGWLERS